MLKTRQDVEREIENANREDRAINLTGWNFAKRVDLMRLNLSGADCRGADLNHAILRYANLEGAKFGILLDWVSSLKRGAIAGLSLLLSCKAVGTHWGDAVLIGLWTGSFVAVASSKGPYSKRTNLRGTDFTAASLKGVDLTGADMPCALLLDTDLSHATVSKSDLKAAILVNTKLAGTGLSLEELPDSIVSTVSINKPEQLCSSLELLTTMHFVGKGCAADTDDICPISYKQGSEIKDPVYVERGNGLKDCYEKEYLARLLRSGHTLNPVTIQEMKKEDISSSKATTPVFNHTVTTPIRENHSSVGAAAN